MTSIRSIVQRCADWGWVAAAALVAALWVGVCAAAPEFIWQGLRIAHGHLTRADLISALLLGAILAFFVEPLMRRLHDLFHRVRRPEENVAGNPLFVAGLGLAFALALVAVHEALSAFISARGGGHTGAEAALEAAIELAIDWAVVPAAIALAWLAAGSRWLKLPLGIVAAASAAIDGWLFSWGWLGTLTTAIPSIVILGLGYRRMTSELTDEPRRDAFTRCAAIVVVVATVWLAAVALVDIVLEISGARFQLYTSADLWLDIRFYIGWTLGLVLSPSSYRRSFERDGDSGAQ